MQMYNDGRPYMGQNYGAPAMGGNDSARLGSMMNYMSGMPLQHMQDFPPQPQGMFGYNDMIGHRDKKRKQDSDSSSEGGSGSQAIISNIKVSKKEKLLNDYVIPPSKESNGCVAPFLQKTYNLLEDSANNDVMKWCDDNSTFIIVDPEVLTEKILPTHFKHNKWSSFVRQLNTYGFRKIDTEKWKFQHPEFIKGQPERLSKIIRRKGNNAPSAVAQRAAAGKALEQGNKIVWSQLKDQLETIQEENRQLYRYVQGVSARCEQTEAQLRRTESTVVRIEQKLGMTEKLLEQALGALDSVSNINANGKRSLESMGRDQQQQQQQSTQNPMGAPGRYRTISDIIGQY